MTKAERKFFDFVRKYLSIFLIGAATMLGLLIRLSGIDFESIDFLSFLNPWWAQIEASGIDGLRAQVGNYNIPYQIIIYLLTLLSIKSLYAYKILSIVFDVVLAVASALLVRELSGKKSSFVFALVYSLVFCSLTVCFNSAFWGQCDSIYVSLILLAIYFLLKDKSIVAFILLGVAFSFKLQTVFILPVLLYYYISTRKISILHFLIIPIVDIIMCLPVIILGRNPMDIINIYIDQTDYGKGISMNCPNIYAFMCDTNNAEYYYLLKQASIALTMLVLGVGLCMVIYKRVDLCDKSKFLLASIWTVFSCIMFLSSMHERYAYLLDVLLIIYVIVSRKHFWLAVACQLISLRGYCQFMFSFDFDIKLTAIAYIAIYVYVSYLFVKDVILNGSLNLPKKQISN